MKLMLQRRLAGDAGRWRTIGRLALDKVDEAMRGADALARLLADLVAMRLVVDPTAPAQDAAVVATWSWRDGWRLDDINALARQIDGAEQKAG